MSHYHKLNRATLQKLRAQYAGGLIARLRAEQERARQRGAAAQVSRLQLQIEDVEEFHARLEKIERGEELQYRIRCRWKGEEEMGRPGPYAPDIDYDLLVVVKERTDEGREMEQRAYGAMWGLRAPVDIVVMTADYFEWMLDAAASLPATVQREGRLLHAA